MKKYCLHTHTYRCGHATGKDEEYIQKAIAEGFDVYGYSDHIMFPNISQPRVRGDFSRFEEYLDSVNKIKEKYKNKIEIHVGFEAEYFKEFTDYYRFLHERKKIEYLILGQHFYFELDRMRSFDNLGLYGAIERYTNDLIEGIKSGLFSIVAHPDLLIYWYSAKDSFFLEHCERIIDAAIEADIPLELNVSKVQNNLRMGDENARYNAPFPVDAFWKIAAKKKAKVVIGLDCHCVDAIDSNGFNYGLELAKEYCLNLIDIDDVISKFN